MTARCLATVALLLVVASRSQTTPSVTVAVGDAHHAGIRVQAYAAPCNNPPTGYQKTGSMLITTNGGVLNCTAACPWDASCRPFTVQSGSLRLNIFARSALLTGWQTRLFWHAEASEPDVMEVQRLRMSKDPVMVVYPSPYQAEPVNPFSSATPSTAFASWYVQLFSESPTDWATLDVIQWEDGWICPSTYVQEGRMTGKNGLDRAEPAWEPYYGTVDQASWVWTGNFSMQASYLSEGERNLNGCLPDNQVGSLTSPLVGYVAQPAGGSMVICRPAYSDYQQPTEWEAHLTVPKALDQDADWSYTWGLSGVIDPWSGACTPTLSVTARRSNASDICAHLTQSEIYCVANIIEFEPGAWPGTGRIANTTN